MSLTNIKMCSFLELKLSIVFFVIRTFAKYNSLFEYLLILREKEKLKKNLFLLIIKNSMNPFKEYFKISL